MQNKPECKSNKKNNKIMQNNPNSFKTLENQITLNTYFTHKLELI